MLRSHHVTSLELNRNKPITGKLSYHITEIRVGLFFRKKKKKTKRKKRKRRKMSVCNDTSRDISFYQYAIRFKYSNEDNDEVNLVFPPPIPAPHRPAHKLKLSLRPTKTVRNKKNPTEKKKRNVINFIERDRT